ncbi:flagellar hook-basal body complex protein FliE [Gilliamella sp. Choc4-2]|jgi:flagellar hook-basal body complex protein FliE|uniref:flagellar hook-basal body complex protein FliE n=1 Tax=unclassified Gilliamella TaxID=2685620 RepID=UPI000558041B|nr:flagellar hook-basal body complex protein FliE [Gilliamella apicola]OCG31033.1 flagellar hook-basal body complex protein FliE [Gilliamella apicola]OCG46601.1 flagellar hook-basal body complex protein FliE [Gilliamella apicola]OCG55884.1 flagellar hook-basal body complex protein FliE [Gilliamella apicola]OCG64769.1 flagellar hook-basal body complex protein FliE [Gilliamella apicola]
MNILNDFNGITPIKLNQITNFPQKQPISADNHFLGELKNALNKISQAQMQANQKAQAFEMGDPNVALNEVMVDMQKSSVSLQFGIQVRNKLVAAYQEIMNMNI